MTDPRENILARLLVILAEVEGVKRAERNTTDVTKLERPGIVLHDGEEQLDDGVGRPDLRGKLQLQILSPQICVYFSTATRDVGNVSGIYRARVLAMIFNDVTLLAMLFDKEVRYQGCTLIPADVSEGREARLEIELHFTYVFRASDFS